MAGTIACWAMAVLLATTVVAQERKPTFEVASIKPQLVPFSPAAGDRAFPRAMPGGVFSPTHATLELLVMFAYDVKRFQVSGAPEWARQVAFQIDARAGRDVPESELKLMVQALLEDRFKLITHSEERTMSVTAIVRAKPDGPLGPYLREVGDNCTPEMAAEIKSKFPPRPVSGGAALQGQCSGISALADMLAVLWQEPVIDKTGLTGKFVHEVRAASVRPNEAPRANADPRLPPLTTALEEQLGLKLEQGRGSVKMIVIDSIQQPTEN